MPWFFALTVETWPWREIGHSFPEIPVSFLEDENLLRMVWKQFKSGLNYELVRGLTHTNSSRVEASHTQHNACSPLHQAARWANRNQSARELGWQVSQVFLVKWEKEASCPCDFMEIASYFPPGQCVHPRVNDMLFFISFTKRMVGCCVGSFLFVCLSSESSEN